MAYLSPALRRALERTIQQARAAAEQGAANALRRLGVAEPRRPEHLTEAQAQLRKHLRAHARALGDARSPDGTQGIKHLTEQAAYVQWHRLLFARFLLERRLLRHPEVRRFDPARLPRGGVSPRAFRRMGGSRSLYGATAARRLSTG